MYESVIALITASALLLGSPGPVPVALAATGATFGIRKSVPFLFGIISGLGFVVCATLFGLSVLLEELPSVKFSLQILSCLYLLYIAFRIATASTHIENQGLDVPDYKTGVILNMVNPKAYAAMLTLLSQPLLESEGTAVTLFYASVCILVIGLIVDTLWLTLGSSLRSVINKKKQQKAVRIIFALLISTLAFYGLSRVL